MKPTDYVVDPKIGLYVVQPKKNGRTARTVTKNKRCSCGGSAQNPCIHIEAVKLHLMGGGRRAEPFESVLSPRAETRGEIEECPICGADVRWAGSYAYPLMWRCEEDPGHYWQWYGEQKVKKFFTDGRQSGIEAIDEMTTNQYEEYLDTLERERYGNQDRAVGGAG
jgi:hypothetical protein